MPAGLIEVWFAIGLAGGGLFWCDWMLDVEKGFHSCPTPRAIFLIAALSFTGPVIFVCGLTVLTITWFTNKDWSDSWWTRPICGRR